MVEDAKPAGSCPECGFIHPPLAVGQKCPLSKQKTDSGEVIECGDFLAQMKNIVVANVQKKKIKNYKKMFSHVIVEVTKFLETYKE